MNPKIETLTNFLQTLPSETAERAIYAALTEVERTLRTEEADGLPSIPKPLNLGSLLDEPPPEIDWLIKNLLPRGITGLIVGQTGVGKTYFGLNLAIWLATSFLDIPFETTKPRKVLYLNNEDGEILLKRRLWFLAQYYRSVWDLVSKNFLLFSVAGVVGPLAECDSSGSLKPSRNFEILEILISKFQPDLVFLDTFSRFYGLRENFSEDASFWLFLLETLARRYETSFLICHHPRKGSVNDIDASRGSSTLVSNTRIVIALEKLEQKLIKMSVLKNNFADFLPTVKFRFEKGIFLPEKEEPALEKIIKILPDAFKKFVNQEVTARELYKSQDFVEFREFVKDKTGILVRDLRYLLPQALEEAVSRGLLQATEKRGKNIQKFYKLVV